MSHVVSIKTEFKSILALKAACDELGLTFKENQKTIRWFGQWVNDYSREDAAYKLGIKPEQYGTCDHAVEVPGSGYDIGFLRNPETGGYRLYFDFWGHNGTQIQNAIGKNGEKLLAYYNTHHGAEMIRKHGQIPFFIRNDADLKKLAAMTGQTNLKLKPGKIAVAAISH